MLADTRSFYVDGVLQSSFKELNNFANAIERMLFTMDTTLPLLSPDPFPTTLAASMIVGERTGWPLILGGANGAPDKPEHVAVLLDRGRASVGKIQHGPALSMTPGEFSVAFLTSGSTGRPKVIPHTAPSMRFQANSVCEALKTDQRTRWGVAVPLDHAYGYSVLNIWLRNGGEFHYFRFGSLKAIAQAITRRSIDTLDAISLTWSLLLDAALQDDQLLEGLRSLKLRGVGGQLLSKQLASEYESVGAPLHDGYGLTEAGPNVAINIPDKYQPGTVGPPLPGVELRLDSRGELSVRSPSVSRLLWDSEIKPNFKVDKNGWLRTGDIAAFSNDQLIIKGRDSSMLHQLAEKIAPEILEEILVRGLERDIQVFVVSIGVSRHKGDILAAALIPKLKATIISPDTLAKIRENARGLPKPFSVRDLVSLNMNELPISSLGKIDRSTLEQSVRIKVGSK